MKKYVRAILDDLQSEDRRAAAKQNGTAGAGGQVGHGGEGRLRGLGEGRKHREIADHPALALDEEHGGRTGSTHGFTARCASGQDPGHLELDHLLFAAVDAGEDLLAVLIELR